MPLSPSRKPIVRKTALKRGGSLRTKKKKTASWYKAEAITIAKFIVKKRTPYCERCKSLGKPIEQWCAGLQGSHIYSVGAHPDMAADLDNIKTLGMYHHLYWWHREVAEAYRWFVKTWPERAERLEIRAQETRKIDWEVKYHELYVIAVQYGWAKPHAI